MFDVICLIINYMHTSRLFYGTVLLYILLYIELEGGFYESKRAVNYLKRKLKLCLFVFGATAPQWALASPFTMTFTDNSTDIHA
jgi:hypothetical protein